jgi:uncharacterized membrane protein YcaP (DUF421 family)
MESVIRGLIVYSFLLFIFRMSGKRTLSDATTFDLVLLLIISETTQQAMIGNDHSLTNALLLILTLVGATVCLATLKQRFKRLETLLEGTAVILIEKGKFHQDRMEKSRVDENDILEAARQQQGIERFDQIKYAILERSGEITVVPNRT